MKNTLIKVLCFGQSSSIFAEKYQQNMVMPVFIAIIINMWSLFILALLFLIYAGEWYWKAFSDFLQPYQDIFFKVWIMVVVFFLATMQFIGTAPEKKEEGEKQ
jgi:hypothetical protein